MSIVIPWGQYKHTPIDHIDSSYLCWVLDRCENAAPDLRQAIRIELQSRFGSPSPPRSRSSQAPCPDPDLATHIVAAGKRALARQHHPDIGGDMATMQRLNATADWLKATVS
jgi:hypothetical protein